MSDTSDVDAIPNNMPELNTALARLQEAIRDQAHGLARARANIIKYEARMVELYRRQHIINKRLRRLAREEEKRANEEAASIAAAAAMQQPLPTSSPTSIPTPTPSPTTPILHSPSTPTLPTTPDWGGSAPGTPPATSTLANTLGAPVISYDANTGHTTRLCPCQFLPIWAT